MRLPPQGAARCTRRRSAPCWPSPRLSRRCMCATWTSSSPPGNSSWRGVWEEGGVENSLAWTRHWDCREERLLSSPPVSIRFDKLQSAVLFFFSHLVVEPRANNLRLDLQKYINDCRSALSLADGPGFAAQAGFAVEPAALGFSRGSSQEVSPGEAVSLL